MSPEENFAFINDYLRRMGPIMRRHGGFIDKYIGDAIMALFPAGPDDALEAAAETARALATWNEERTAAGLSPVGVGVGIHFGSLMLGTVGESERMEGTVISDVVNTASRIEGLTKTYGSMVLLSREARDALARPERWHIRRVGREAVRGRNAHVELHELLDVASTHDGQLRAQTRDLFEAALDDFLAGRVPEARTGFAAVLERDSNDRTAALYLQLCG